MTRRLEQEVSAILRGEDPGVDEEWAGLDDEGDSRKPWRQQPGEASAYDLGTNLGQTAAFRAPEAETRERVDVEAIKEQAEEVVAEVVETFGLTEPPEPEPLDLEAVVHQAGQLAGGTNGNDWKDQFRYEGIRREEAMRAEARAEVEQPQE